MANPGVPRIAIAAVGILALLFGGAGYWWMTRSRGPSLDTPIREALAHTTETRAYSHHVESEMGLPDRSLHVNGIYIVNEPQMSYSAESTTTLSIPGSDIRPSFSLHNISIGSDVYITVHTDSPALKGSIPAGPWRHFKADAIPTFLSGIAISGPVLDNLGLIRTLRPYLTLLEKGQASWGNESLLKYVFTIRNDVPTNNPATESLIGRIGRGNIDIWVDPTTHRIAHMVFSNPPYYSTTTVQYSEPIRDLVPPIPTTSDKL